MSEKARKILDDVKRRDQTAKLWKLFRSPDKRNRVLGEFNQSILDEVGPVGGDQGMRVLNEMNELGQQEEQSIRKSLQSIHLL